MQVQLEFDVVYLWLQIISVLCSMQIAVLMIFLIAHILENESSWINYGVFLCHPPNVPIYLMLIKHHCILNICNLFFDVALKNTMFFHPQSFIFWIFRKIQVLHLISFLSTLSMKHSDILLVVFSLIFSFSSLSSKMCLFSHSGGGRGGVQCSDLQLRIVCCEQCGFLLTGSVSSLGDT